MAPPRRPRSAPALIDDLIGSILLRVPPDEPAHLIRAALVCKPWRRILFDPAFLRRYREFHGTRPLLGFLLFKYPSEIFPTTTASPFSTLEFPDGHWWTLDCRHGRVLLWSHPRCLVLLLRDPVTGDQERFRLDLLRCSASRTAATTSTVVAAPSSWFAGTAGTEVYDHASWVIEYSSVTGSWSSLTNVDFSASNKVGFNCYFGSRPSLFIGDAVYFVIKDGVAILKYDLAQKGQLVIDTPDNDIRTGHVMMAEDGGLGFAGVMDYNIYLWSWKANTEGIAGWLQLRVIELMTLLPLPKKYPEVIGFMEGTDTIFINTYDDIFTLKIKSRQVRKLGHIFRYGFVLSYASFYTPGSLSVGRKVKVRT